MKTKKLDNKGCLEGTLGVWGWIGAVNQLTLGLWRNQTHMWGGGWFLCCIERTLRQSTEKLYSDQKSLWMLWSRASSSTSWLRPELWLSTSGSQRSLTKSSLRPFWIFLTSSMRSYHPTTISRQWKRTTKEGAVQCKETHGARLERGGNSRPGRRGEGDFGVWGQGIWRGSLVV